MHAMTVDLLIACCLTHSSSLLVHWLTPPVSCVITTSSDALLLRCVRLGLFCDRS